ncbi:MAG TPA: hypothetical protein VNT58_03475 [Gaiellaceae bacterium]|nr:hypothetical protein [Gaiellaceae bacterium]
MEFRIDFGAPPADVTLVTAGRATLDGFERMIHTLVDDPRFRPGMVILVDHTDLDLNALTDDDIAGVAETTREVAETLQAALLVIVAPTIIGYGLSRRWQSLVADLGIAVRVEMSRDDAEIVICAQREAAG